MHIFSHHLLDSTAISVNSMECAKLNDLNQPFFSAKMPLLRFGRSWIAVSRVFLLTGDLRHHDDNHQVRKPSLLFFEDRELVLKSHLLWWTACFSFRRWNKFAALFSVARVLSCTLRSSHQAAAMPPSLAKPSTQDTGRGPMIEISAGPCVGDSIKKTITNGWTLSVHQHGSARRI